MIGAPATAGTARLDPAEVLIMPSMSFERIERSFTLCPSNNGSGAPFTEKKHHGNVEKKQGEEGNVNTEEVDVQGVRVDCSASSKVKAKVSAPCVALPCKQNASISASIPRPASTGNVPVMIPGTLLQDWRLPSRHKYNYKYNRSQAPPRAFRASPFEPLVHQRNLPKSGTITPLKMDEYYADSQHQNRQQQQQHQHLYESQTHREAHFDSPTTSDEGIEGQCQPPVREVRILHSSVTSVASSDATVVPTEWQSLYFSSQRDLHETQRRCHKAEGENRHLKRAIFELQRQLYTVQRNKWNNNECNNSSWDVPGRHDSAREGISNKRLRTETVTAVEQQQQQRYDSSAAAAPTGSQQGTRQSPSL
jgi:hypothetical protein